MFLHLRSALALSGILAIGLIAGAARADIQYTYFTSLVLESGPDPEGLAGATATLTFTIPTGATYADFFGFPSVSVENAQVTFSGASVTANNGTFGLGPTVFLPTFAGFVVADTADFHEVSLGEGGPLTIPGFTDPTADGSLVTVGDVVAASHFGPTTASSPITWTSFNSGTSYVPTEISITAFEAGAATAPEPGSAALIGVLAIVSASCSRRRRLIFANA